MDLSSLKKLVRESGNNFIVLENGEPELVILSFREYEKLLEECSRASRSDSSDGGFSDFAREAASNETEVILPSDTERGASGGEGRAEQIVRDSHPPSQGLPIRLEDIRLEDLPI